MSRTSHRENEILSDRSDWFRPIARENLSEMVYIGLRGALMHGQLRSGERLQLRRTSQRFGISATPMREAFMRLVSEKALALDSRGTVVVPTITMAELLEIRAIRKDLEGRAAAAAAQHATPSEIAALVDIHAGIAASREPESFPRAIDLNTEFHLMLCRMGRLPIVFDFVEQLWVRCGPILSHLYDAGVPDWEPHPHLRVIEALRRRDPETARDAICEDIERGGKGLIMYVAATSASEGGV